jgi:hypothetical protein
VQHCGDNLAWSDTNAADVDTNFSTYHLGIGTGVYWFMGGPGVDPHYDGTTTEAYAWGQQQAIRTLSDVAKLTVTYPVIFADVELPGNAPGMTSTRSTPTARRPPTAPRPRDARWSPACSARR